MLKKNFSFWWFIFLAGIFIPIISSFTFQTYPYYFFTEKIIAGLNPGLIYLANFLVIFIIGIIYIHLKINLAKYLIISTIIFVFFYIGFFIHSDNDYTFDSARRYFDSNIIAEGVNKWHLLLPNIAISILFILFAIRNYSLTQKM